MKFTEEQLKKMNSAKTAEELIALAKAEGIEATEEQIKAQFDAMHSEGELADDELDNVSGAGCGGSDDSEDYKCPDCGGELKLTCIPLNGHGYWYIYKCSNCGTEYEKTVTGFGDKVH